MPPQSPLAASPIGMAPCPGSGIVMSGTFGKAFEKCSPFDVGEKSATRALFIAAYPRPPLAGRYDTRIGVPRLPHPPLVLPQRYLLRPSRLATEEFDLSPVMTARHS